MRQVTLTGTDVFNITGHSPALVPALVATSIHPAAAAGGTALAPTMARARGGGVLGEQHPGSNGSNGSGSGGAGGASPARKRRPAPVGVATTTVGGGGAPATPSSKTVVGSGGGSVPLTPASPFSPEGSASLGSSGSLHRPPSLHQASSVKASSVEASGSLASLPPASLLLSAAALEEQDPLFKDLANLPLDQVTEPRSTRCTQTL